MLGNAPEIINAQPRLRQHAGDVSLEIALIKLSNLAQTGLCQRGNTCDAARAGAAEPTQRDSAGQRKEEEP
jgi:hypothetical protein